MVSPNRNQSLPSSIQPHPPGTLPPTPSSTTAANRGKRCRCGKPSHAAHRRQLPLEHLPSPPPSATAANRGKHCRCGKPSHAAHRRQLPLEHLPSPPPSATAANRGKHCRCGKPPHAAHRRQHPLGHHTVTTSIRNGSKSRETLPVWQTATCRTSTTAPSGTPYRHHLHPQRQQIAEFGAVVVCMIRHTMPCSRCKLHLCCHQGALFTQTVTPSSILSLRLLRLWNRSRVWRHRSPT